MNGDTSAAQKATSYYSQLDSLSPTVSNQLHNMNYDQAKSYIDSLPKAHGGGETLSYGAVYMKPGELIFPPNLSGYMKDLISMAKSNSSPNQATQSNSRVVYINGPLFNSEKTVIEDEADQTSFANEIKRALSNL